jgi:hypothetical protein
MNNITACVCELPRRLRQPHSSNLYRILDEDELFARLSETTKRDIEKYLRVHQELIEDWLIFSSDQRCTPSHYFVEIDGGYEIARFPSGIKSICTDRIVACAEFIIRDVDSLLDHRD